jgi:hypothetical protein
VQPRGGQAQIRGNMTIPSDGTTFSHNIKEDGNAIRTNGERPRWTTLFSALKLTTIQTAPRQVSVFSWRNRQADSRHVSTAFHTNLYSQIPEQSYF